MIFDGEAFGFRGCFSLSRGKRQFRLEFEISADDTGNAGLESVFGTDGQTCTVLNVWIWTWTILFRRITSETISLALPKLNFMEEGLVNPH